MSKTSGLICIPELAEELDLQTQRIRDWCRRLNITGIRMYHNRWLTEKEAELLRSVANYIGTNRYELISEIGELKYQIKSLKDKLDELAT